MPMRLDEGMDRGVIRLESDSVQFVGLYSSGIWIKLHIDVESDDSCELQDPENILFGSFVQRGGAATGVQALPADPEAAVRWGLMVHIRADRKLFTF